MLLKLLSKIATLNGISNHFNKSHLVSTNRLFYLIILKFIYIIWRKFLVNQTKKSF